ncbi:MAG: endonuclease III domain-containing protein [Endomicrobiales bacterium]|nr:endonuclease III domain-containing protein [Endomicrobiales bacterium]
MKRKTNSAVLGLYGVLYKKFGPQGWWPVTRKPESSPGYHPLDYERNPEREKFEICAGAILTQNTSWKNVEKAVRNLTGAQILAFRDILKTPVSKLARLIRPSGYFNQKAARLKIFSRHISEKHGGRVSNLLLKPYDAARAELLSIKGIGPETADSMLLYAGGRPSFVVDAYTKRIGSRMGFFENSEGYDRIKAFFESALPASPRIFNEFHALLVELAKRNCRKEPYCAGCPASGSCGYGKKKRRHIEKSPRA